MARSEGCDLVFTNRSRRPYSRAGFRPTWRRVVVAAGITDLTFHDLRHHFATSLRRRGVQLDTIAKLLGHTTLAMTQRCAHLGDAQMAAAVAELPPLPKPDATQKPTAEPSHAKAAS